MSKDLTVKFKKIYSYYGDLEDSRASCKCELKLYLPMEEGSEELALMLRSAEELFGEPLAPYWGKVYGKSMAYWCKVYGKSRVRSKFVWERGWRELEDAVQRLIKETLCTLKEVVAVNKAALEAQPEDCEVEYTITV